MALTERISVEVPSDVAGAMRAQISAGRYATESEAVTEALRYACEAEDHEIDAWLRGPVAEAYDEVMAGTMSLFTVEEVREKLGLAQ